MNRMAENLEEKITAFKNRSMELEAVHSSMQEGVIAIDKDEKIITVNSAAAKIFNFPPAQLKARDILEVARNVDFQSFLQRALATHAQVEEDIAIKNKEDRILNIHSTALYDVNRMIHLINNRLALSKLERMEGTDIRFEEQSVLFLIQAAVQTCYTGIQKKQIDLSVDCPEDLMVEADPVLMEQAIINLLDNAVKYSPEQSCVTIRAALKDHRVEMVIQDQGFGIAQEHQSKIFNRFFRVDMARSRHEGGTGLGLAIVKHIVHYHQGTVGVESVKDQGASFKMSLPVHIDADEPTAH